MMLLCAHSNRIWHYWAGKYPGSVGVLLSPAYFRKVPLDPWMPFVLDNDAYGAWRDKKAWSQRAWLEMFAAIRLTGRTPLWAAVPDVVADAQGTLDNWQRYAFEVQRLGWPTAFCVQDGMTPKQVPKDADVIFVGGTDAWKFPNLHLWTGNFPRVHCGRVAPSMFERCEQMGCESVDGSSWFVGASEPNKLPTIARFIEGHRRERLEPELVF